MNKNTFVFCMTFVVACAAQAQVFKCTGPTGKTIYTDEPCKGKRIDDAQLQSNTVIGGPRLRSLPPDAPQQAQPATRQLGVCPTRLEVRNIETAASSSRFSPGSAEHAFMQNEVMRAATCDPARTTYTVDDWKTLQTYHSYQSRIDAHDRRVARDRALQLHGMRGGY